MVAGQPRRTWILLLAGGFAMLCVLLAASGTGVSTPTDTSDIEGVENVSLYATADDNFDDAADIETAIENGTLETADDVIVGETLVIAIDSERLTADLSAPNSSSTERFFEMLADDIYFALIQQDVGPNVKAKTIGADPTNTKVYRNGTTAYLSLETDDLDVQFYPPWEESDADATLYSGDRFAVAFGYDPTDLYRGPHTTVYFNEAEFVDATDVVEPTVVTGTVRTHIPPERDLAIRTIFENGSTDTVQLPADSASAEYSLDLRSVPPETTYTLELLHDGDVVDRHEGTIREPEATLQDANVTAIDDEEVDARITLSANLSHGGTVLVRDGFGARVGSRTVSPGRTTDLSIDLRFNEDGTIDFDRLSVVAIRNVGDVEQRYPGQDANLMLDVSEYEWGTDNWTPGSNSDGTNRTNSTDGMVAENGADDGDQSDASPDDVPTVGTELSDSNENLASFGTTAGLVGLVTVLCSTGYLLRGRFGIR